MKWNLHKYDKIRGKFNLSPTELEWHDSLKYQVLCDISLGCTQYEWLYL